MLQRFGLLVLFVCLCPTAVHAQWIQRESRTEPGIGAPVLQHVVLENSATGATATLELVRFSPKSVRLKSIDNPGGRDLADVMSTGNYLAGVNGGYFDENFGPLGLRISEARTLSPLIRSRLMSGVIVASDSTLQILRTGEFRKNSRNSTALQCGPFLVDRGRPVAGLNSTKPARRTFVAVAGSDGILGFCSSVSLARLSSILVSAPGGLKIERALNLDGGSSSAFWFNRKDGTALSISEYKTVRDFVAISPR